MMVVCIRHCPPPAVKYCPWVMGYARRKDLNIQTVLCPDRACMLKTCYFFLTLTPINVLFK